MQDLRLIRLGGYCALLAAAMQIVGNIMHPPIPRDTIAALGVIAGSGNWLITHLILSSSYFIFIPLAVGAAASFRNDPPTVRIAIPLIIFGTALGVTQILTHLTLFRFLAEQYAATSDAAVRSTIVFVYDAFWPYNVALEVGHLTVIDLSALLFGIAMLDEKIYPRWLALVGCVGGIVAVVGLYVGTLAVRTTLGDVIFAVSLIPMVIFIVATGIILIRLQPALAPATAG